MHSVWNYLWFTTPRLNVSGSTRQKRYKNHLLIVVHPKRILVNGIHDGEGQLGIFTVTEVADLGNSKIALPLELCLNFTCWRFSKFSISSTWICQQRSRCRCQYRQGLHIILYLPMVPMRLYECLRIPECLERSDIQKELSFSKYMIFSLFVSMSWLTLKYHGSGRPFYSTGHWEAKPVDGSRLARSHTNTNQRPTVSLAIGIEAESFIRAFEVKLRRLASYQAHIPRYASPVSPLAEPRLLMAFSLARKAR